MKKSLKLIQETLLKKYLDFSNENLLKGIVFHIFLCKVCIWKFNLEILMDSNHKFNFNAYSVYKVQITKAIKFSYWFINTKLVSDYYALYIVNSYMFMK